MQITDDIILKYSGSLLEIYTVNTDSYSVGSIALYSNSEILPYIVIQKYFLGYMMNLEEKWHYIW